MCRYYGSFCCDKCGNRWTRYISPLHSPIPSTLTHTTKAAIPGKEKLRPVVHVTRTCCHGRCGPLRGWLAATCRDRMTPPGVGCVAGRKLTARRVSRCMEGTGGRRRKRTTTTGRMTLTISTIEALLLLSPYVHYFKNNFIYVHLFG